MEHLWDSFTEELASAVINKLERNFDQGLDLEGVSWLALNQKAEPEEVLVKNHQAGGSVPNQDQQTLAAWKVNTRETLVKIPQAGGGVTNQEQTLAPQKVDTKEAVLYDCMTV